MRAFLLLQMAAALLAQQPLDPTDRLIRARGILADRDKRLPDYTCVQTVDRSYLKGRRVNSPSSSCDQLRSLSPRDLVLESTDRLRLDIKVSQGSEIGSWGGSQFSSRSIFELIGGGPYETGMLGALIQDIFLNELATYQYTGEESTAGTKLYIYTYQVPLRASHYQIKAGSSWVVIAFHGAFWLDSNTLELERLTVQSAELPPETGACDIDTAVDYQKVRVGDGEFLLPRQSSIRALNRDGTETHVTAVYSSCRAYLSEATIRFDEPPAVAGTMAGKGRAAPLPAGVSLSLALTEPIDTDKAAAGDIVRAKVRKPARDPRSKAILVPAGAIVEGRIVDMQHWLSEPPYFAISILLEKLELSGVSRPLYANVKQRGLVIALPPVGESARVAAFPFATDKSRYVVPTGYESEWVTVEPSEETK